MACPFPHRAPALSDGREEGCGYRWPSREHGRELSGRGAIVSVILKAQECGLEPKGPVLWS